ncbi:hypothetical protein O0I10_000062 [Lichtheimia ornata]|uniref:SAP domain-containing protein n=1 Tax=Lichtheimia ornata TaxID=688661 RepID=A0AAD7Y4R4_9FUNG|nr:uncharacterized protein O0I10_000062 [Lichtheimia ornata]KAJ8663788.1 hypothetical protein O0I10_000062 [Lichtheimia ornata]
MSDEQSKATTVESLRKALADLGLDTRGHKPELKKRLRKAKKKLNATSESSTTTTTTASDQPNPAITKKQQPLDYYLFFDVEATCEENGGFEYPNEIIEFPIVLVDGKSFEKVDEFRSYVKPSINPVLSAFCKQLTGISQETVDDSPDFIQVLNDFQEFMAKYSVFQDKTAAFVTDGPFDIRDFVTKQCKHSNIKLPSYFEMPWVNIRKLFKDFYKQKEAKNIARMLETLDMTFDGREHSGLDDARNLHRIAQHMVADGCIFKTNMFWGPKMRAQQRRARKS